MSRTVKTKKSQQFGKKRGTGKSKSSGSPARRPTMKKSSAVWDQAAQWYDALVGLKGSEYQKAVIFPGALQMMALKKGESVLDLACGQGVFSRYLSQKGMKVTGLDTSEEMIRFARSRSDKSLRFEHGDAQDAQALEGKVFDAVVCLLALQNIESLPPVMHNVQRWLKPGGRFVMVTTHPCFRIPRQTHWGWDEQKKIQYRRVDLYGSESAIPILTPPFAQSKTFTVTYHRPLQSYFQALAEAGLCVEGLEEWTSHKTSDPGKRSKAENRARQEIPLFLALRAVPAALKE
jgi:ubiquinone/menaquinone biosynthesis C-methylase UbiE